MPICSFVKGQLAIGKRQSACDYPSEARSSERGRRFFIAREVKRLKSMLSLIKEEGLRVLFLIDVEGFCKRRVINVS